MFFFSTFLSSVSLLVVSFLHDYYVVHNDNDVITVLYTIFDFVFFFFFVIPPNISIFFYIFTLIIYCAHTNKIWESIFPGNLFKQNSPQFFNYNFPLTIMITLHHFFHKLLIFYFSVYF